MKKCPTGKRLYSSENLAEDALIEAHIQFDYAPNQGPVSVYLCPDCKFYHLSSQGILNKRLAEAQADGSIKRQKEANRWINKFKGK